MRRGHGPAVGTRSGNGDTVLEVGTRSGNGDMVLAVGIRFGSGDMVLAVGTRSGRPGGRRGRDRLLRLSGRPLQLSPAGARGDVLAARGGKTHHFLYMEMCVYIYV